MTSEVSGAPGGDATLRALPTWYFNGEALPHWAGYIVQCRLLQMAQEVMQDRDERVGWNDLWILWCRLDHECVESEEPLRFRICISTLLVLLLAHRELCLLQLREGAREAGVTEERLYADVREGLIRMLELVQRDGVAFWVSGKEEARLELVEWMQCCGLPADDPRHRVEPHVSHDRSEASHRLKELHIEMNTAAQSHGSDIAGRVHLAGK